MFRCVASDRPPGPGYAMMNNGLCTSPRLSLLPPARGGTRVPCSRPQIPPTFPLPCSPHFFRGRAAPMLPILRVTGCRAGPSLFLRSSSSTKTRPSPGADRLRAARLGMGLSPPPYLSALTTNPVELRARRGRCRFGPPAVFRAYRTRGPPLGKVPHGVYRQSSVPSGIGMVFPTRSLMCGRRSTSTPYRSRAWNSG